MSGFCKSGHICNQLRVSEFCFVCNLQQYAQTIVTVEELVYYLKSAIATWDGQGAAAKTVST